MKINSEIFKHYAYRESFELQKDVKNKKKLSFSELQAVTKHQLFNKSDAIILVYDYLKGKYEENAVPKFWPKIKQFYLDTNYESCVNLLLLLGKKFLTENEYIFLLDLFSQAKEIQLEKNDSRHFFENRMAQFYFANELNIESINKISLVLTKQNVTSVDDAIEVLGKNTQRNEELMIIQKALFFTYRKDTVYRTSKNVYSSNKGIMRGMAPNFYDEISNHPMTNRVIDTRKIDPIKIKLNCSPLSYAKENSRAAYVSSLSGHAILLAIQLRNYIQNHLTDNELSNDINNYIKSFIATYILNGHHSFREIEVVFKEEIIQEWFNDINLNLYFSDDVLEKAFKETSQYVYVNVNRRIVQQDLLADVSEKLISESRSSTPSSSP